MNKLETLFSALCSGNPAQVSEVCASVKFCNISSHAAVTLMSLFAHNLMLANFFHCIMHHSYYATSNLRHIPGLITHFIVFTTTLK